jgi:predicted nucleic acid-binding protein
MNGVLADTSVWVGHFREGNPVLADLLAQDGVLTHPMVIGELACGTPPDRLRTLSSLELLRQTQHASLREVMTLVERERLYGVGCGIVDMFLLASTLMTPGVALWTLDRRLSALADRFGVMYRAARHCHCH